MTPELITEAGDPKDAIKSAAEKLNINLLVVGSHGEGALKRFVIVTCSCMHKMLKDFLLSSIQLSAIMNDIMEI